MRHGWKRQLATLLYRRVGSAVLAERSAMSPQPQPPSSPALGITSCSPNTVLHAQLRLDLQHAQDRYGLGLTTAPKEEQRKTISFVTGCYLCQLEMLFSSVIVPPPSWPNPSGYLTSTAQLRHPHSALQCHSCCPSLGNRWAHCPEHSDTSPNIGKCRKRLPPLQELGAEGTRKQPQWFVLCSPEAEGVTVFPQPRKGPHSCHPQGH